MRFLIPDIRAARVVEADESLGADVLGTPPSFMEFAQSLRVRAEARMTESDIVVSGRVTTAFTVTCARCLERVEKPLDVRFQQAYPADGLEIDVTSEIREAVLIELPLAATCREGCRGLCPDCGVNRNVSTCKCAPAASDARWDALKQFRFK
jgi:uncharacterized protein